MLWFQFTSCDASASIVSGAQSGRDVVPMRRADEFQYFADPYSHIRGELCFRYSNPKEYGSRFHPTDDSCDFDIQLGESMSVRLNHAAERVPFSSSVGMVAGGALRYSISPSQAKRNDHGRRSEDR